MAFDTMDALAQALTGSYPVQSEDARFPYSNLASALANTDESAHNAMWGQPGTTNRQVTESVSNYLRGLKGMQPKTVEEAAYYVPGVNNVLSARDAYNGATEGDWRKTLAGALGAVPVPFLGGIFVGVGAKTADRAALQRAEQMAASGHTPESIWKDTGWFTGADGKWRFEIPDNTSAFNRGAMTAARPGFPKEGVAGDVLTHNDLYSAYPDFRDYPVMLQSGIDAYGRYFPGGMIELNPRIRDPRALSTMLHEMQHGVQEAEGFARGGTQQPFGKLSGVDALLDPYESYRRHAGEVEARNVQSRMNMTPEERAATPPWLTQDVPNEQQIVRFE